jgi:hypothetical protein
MNMSDYADYYDSILRNPRTDGRREIDKARVAQHYADQLRIAELAIAMSEIIGIIDRMPQNSVLAIPFLAWQFKYYNLLNKEPS